MSDQRRELLLSEVEPDDWRVFIERVAAVCEAETYRVILIMCSLGHESIRQVHSPHNHLVLLLNQRVIGEPLAGHASDEAIGVKYIVPIRNHDDAMNNLFYVNPDTDSTRLWSIAAALYILREAKRIPESSR